MNAIQHAIGLARKRVFLQRWLDRMGWLLLAALSAALVLRLVDRLFAMPVPWLAYAGLGTAALLIAPALALLHRLSDHSAAALIDQRLGLKDRLATALFARTLPYDPFAQQVVRDAQEAAARSVVQIAFPIRLTRGWRWVPVSAAMLALIWAFFPQDMLGIRQARQQLAQRQQQAQEQGAAAKEEIVKAIAAMQKVEDPRGDTKLHSETADAMRELADLIQRDLSNPQMRREAAANFSSLQEKLAQGAQQKEQQVQSIQNAMSRLDTQTPGPADRFADALRRGDFQTAQKELEQLAKEVNAMSGPDKQALLQQLQNLANQLQQAAQQQQQQQARTQQQQQQAMQNAGLNQQQMQQVQQQLQQGASQQQIQQTLQQQGMNQQQAQQLAQQLTQQQQQMQQQGQCQNSANGLGQSLQQMSQGLNQQMQQNQQGQGNQGQQGQGNQQQQAPGNQQGQPGQGSQQFQQGAQQGGQQLSQIAQMQQQLQQMRMSQGQMQQAMQGLGAPGGGSSNSPQFNNRPPPLPGMARNFGDNSTGPGIGTEPGGDPRGPERSMGGYQSEARGDIGKGQGRVIASWMTQGDMSKGEATVEFDKARTQARSDAEKALVEDRVPNRYREAIKSYFNQLPASPEEVKKSSAPPAPK